MPNIPISVLNANATMPLSVKLWMSVSVLGQRSWNLPFRETWRRDVFAGEVKEVLVSSSVADGRNTASFARVEMVLRQFERSLQSEGIFDECCDQT